MRLTVSSSARVVSVADDRRSILMALARWMSGEIYRSFHFSRLVWRKNSRYRLRSYVAPISRKCRFNIKITKSHPVTTQRLFINIKLQLYTPCRFFFMHIPIKYCLKFVDLFKVGASGRRQVWPTLHGSYVLIGDLSRAASGTKSRLVLPELVRLH